MLCRYKDAMKKIECRGGKATVLWGVSDNPINFTLTLISSGEILQILLSFGKKLLIIYFIFVFEFCELFMQL